jgi:hypothetical protein
MQQPAIQAALHDLVEAIRTSLMAEFLELLRSGKPARKLPRAPKRKPPARRSATDLTQVSKLIVSQLRKNPDARVEQLAAALGDYTSKDLAPPLKKLLADKVIAKRGQSRGTTYRLKS